MTDYASMLSDEDRGIVEALYNSVSDNQDLEAVKAGIEELAAIHQERFEKATKRLESHEREGAAIRRSIAMHGYALQKLRELHD